MLFQPHRFDSGSGVSVIGRTDADDVEFVAEVVEEFSKVCELLSVFEFLALFFKRATVNVTNADDFHILIRNMAAVAVAFSADADTGRRQALQG